MVARDYPPPTGRLKMIKKQSHETRRTRHDFQLLFSGDCCRAARLLPAGGAQRRSGARVSGRQGLCGAARWRGRFRRRIGAFGFGGISRMAGREAPVRGGAGPKQCFNYTRESIATTDRLVERSPEIAAAAVRAIVKTQAALKNDVSLATGVGRKLFPPEEAELIAELIRRDLPYYDAKITPEFVAGMNAFAREMGILSGDVPYERIVATRFVEERPVLLLSP